jgi:hypothetical protein
MRVGAALLLIAVGAILRFGISTVSTHGFGVHTTGDILMIVGILGAVLWLLVWAPWAPRARSRRTVTRREVPPEEVPPTGRNPVGYPVGHRYEVDDTYEDEEYRQRPLQGLCMPAVAQAQAVEPVFA